MPLRYVIVGGGLAGASAIEGIRSRDQESEIVLISRENYPPYHRPPLSKSLWFGKETLETVPVYNEAFYREHKVQVVLRREVVEVDRERLAVWDDHHVEYAYDRLLLATGGRPARLNIPGAEIEGVHYYRDLEDYFYFRDHIKHVEHVLVVGGGFIGMEMAAALSHAGLQVTSIYPSEYPLARLFPRDLGLFVADYYRQKGIETVSADRPISIEQRGTEIQVRTANGGTVTTQLILAGIGIEPSTDLAEACGLDIDNGIVVDEMARTSDPNIWAAGDIAEYPDPALHRLRRIEHWDHALNHGRCAGVNMAGGGQPYAGLPMFFSDFFDLGWEAVGDLDVSFDFEYSWKVPHREGVVFYLDEGVTRGLLLWGVFEKVEAARALIREDRPMSMEERLKILGM